MSNHEYTPSRAEAIRLRCCGARARLGPGQASAARSMPVGAAQCRQLHRGRAAALVRCCAGLRRRSAASRSLLHSCITAWAAQRMAALCSQNNRRHGGGVPRSGLVKGAPARAAGGALAGSCALPARPLNSVLVRHRGRCECCLRAYK